MTAPRPARRWPLRCAAVAAVVLFLVLVARFWHPVYGLTALIQLDAPNDNLKIDAFREHPVYVHRDTGGYDGLYYAQIAYDPLLRSVELAPAIDNLSYRARRILPPAVAWLLAAGQPAAIVHVYSFLNVAAWLALAALLWRILAVADFRGGLAWAGVLFSCGALSSVRLALTDLPMALFTFNLGVEAGQMLIISATLAVIAGLRRLTPAALRPGVLASAYAIGSIASFWFIERIWA